MSTHCILVFLLLLSAFLATSQDMCQSSGILSNSGFSVPPQDLAFHGPSTCSAETAHNASCIVLHHAPPLDCICERTRACSDSIEYANVAIWPQQVLCACPQKLLGNFSVCARPGAIPYIEYGPLETLRSTSLGILRSGQAKNAS
ncbi:hypothetical protein PM082_018324 [Marasmius tenuissimus]|nr:hypothetical protein PM082_018324 [Marasmius tenuissimus]